MSTFKAAQGWNISTKKSASKAVMDESGLVGAVCFHGVGLRFLNIHGTGQCHTHAIALLEETLQECSDSTPAYAMTLLANSTSAIKALLPGHSITTRIGRFHLLGHGLSCQVNYNPVRDTWIWSNGRRGVGTVVVLHPASHTARKSLKFTQKAPEARLVSIISCTAG